MPYATTARFIQEYGLDETTQLLQDTQRQVTSDLVAQAVAGTLPTVPVPPVTQAMLDATVAGMARFTRKLTNVSNYMDGYLRSVVALPLAPEDASAGTLEECCLVLTKVGLAIDCDNATDRMDKLADQWRTWLKDVQAGRVQLVRSDTGTNPPIAKRFRSGATKSNYDWAFNERFGRGGGAL